MAKPLSESEVADLVKIWYKKLDVHAPLVDFLPLLGADGLEMTFPEATLHGLAEFEGWYERVIRIFFDEVHQLKEVKINLQGESAEVNLIVEWQASVWNPPAPKSQRIVLDADQSWVVKRSSQSGEPVIVKYVVNALNYHEGSAKL